VTLLDARPGDTIVIEESNLGRSAQKRLWDLGLLPGTKAKVICSHPFKGPILLEVDNSRLAIGRRLARQISVSKEHRVGSHAPR
jgi:ferrous iron transport protein A